MPGGFGGGSHDVEAIPWSRNAGMQDEYACLARSMSYLKERPVKLCQALSLTRACN